MSRYDYVKYDEKSAADQAYFKTKFEHLSRHVAAKIKSPRAQALIQTKLEEAYAWIGKGIRDDQIERGPTELQEGRSDS